MKIKLKTLEELEKQYWEDMTIVIIVIIILTCTFAVLIWLFMFLKWENHFLFWLRVTFVALLPWIFFLKIE